MSPAESEGRLQRQRPMICTDGSIKLPLQMQGVSDAGMDRRVPGIDHEATLVAVQSLSQSTAFAESGGVVACIIIIIIIINSQEVR